MEHICDRAQTFPNIPLPPPPPPISFPRCTILSNSYLLFCGLPSDMRCWNDFFVALLIGKFGLPYDGFAAGTAPLVGRPTKVKM